MNRLTQRDNQASSIASGASNNTNAAERKLLVDLWLAKITSYWPERSLEHAAWRKICEEFNSRMKCNKIINLEV